MKKILLTCLAGATLLSAQAQLFSPESFGGALWGGLIGGTIGGNRHHGFSGDGAAIGAGIGFLAGALSGEARRNYYYDAPGGVYSTAPSVSIGYGYGNCGNSAYVYYAPNSYCAPGYYYRPTRPNYAVSGTVLGAASGALIGAGDRHAGKGAAIGAAAGLVLGSVAEITTQQREKKLAAQLTYPASTTVQANPPLPKTQDARRKTQDSPAQITSRPAKNSTYHWTARPQIPDAPRVPDAPTF